MPWCHPAPRMREMILAIRAIWDCWNNGTKLDFRGDFYTHTLMTPFFNPGPEPVRRAEDLPRRRRRADDRGRRRGGRRVPLPRLHHRAVPPRGHAAGARARAGQGGQDDGRLRDRRPELRRHRHHRGGDSSTAAAGHEAADRVLRLDAGVPGRARRCTAGATCRTSSTRCRSRASGSRWATSSTTRSSTPSPSSASPRRSRPSCTARYGDVIQRISFYAPVQVRSGTVAGRAGGAQGRLTPQRRGAGGAVRIGRSAVGPQVASNRLTRDRSSPATRSFSSSRRRRSVDLRSRVAGPAFARGVRKTLADEGRERAEQPDADGHEDRTPTTRPPLLTG